MGWSSLPIEVREAAERELTRKQLDVLKLWTSGYSTRRIGLMLGVSEATARAHRDRALQKLKPYMEAA